MAMIFGEGFDTYPVHSQLRHLGETVTGRWFRRAQRAPSKAAQWVVIDQYGEIIMHKSIDEGREVVVFDREGDIVNIHKEP